MNRALRRIHAQTGASTRVSTLTNGIRVASEDEKGHFAGVGAYLQAGSRFESPNSPGLAHFNDRLAFKSTLHRSRDQATALMEKLGSNVQCSSGRENIMYQANIFKHDIPDAVDLIADTIRYPIVTDDEMTETQGTILWELQQNFEKPEWLMPELAHQTAYSQNTLGLPQVCMPERVMTVTREQVDSFRQQFYRPSNLVIAGLGVPHEMLCELADRHFGSMKEPDAPKPLIEPVRYTGGSLLKKDKDAELTRLFFGFESPAFNSEDIYPISVLQLLLGGGDSFSAGGPGKGMHSRLYTRVLNRYYWVESITATNTCYKDSGLFGFQAAVPPMGVNNILHIIGSELRSVLDGHLSADELERSKNQLMSMLFMNLETKLVHLEDIGRQIQMNGTRRTPKEMSEKIEQVTHEDIKRVIRKMIHQVPTFVVVGETKYVPKLEQFLKAFGFGPGR